MIRLGPSARLAKYKSLTARKFSFRDERIRRA